jgi:hypothetical protein
MVPGCEFGPVPSTLKTLAVPQACKEQLDSMEGMQGVTVKYV